MKFLMTAAVAAAVLLAGSTVYTSVVPWANGQAAHIEATEFARALQLDTTLSYADNDLAYPRLYVDETLATTTNSQHITVATDRSSVWFVKDDDQCVVVNVPDSVEPNLLAAALEPHPCDGTTLALAPVGVETLLDPSPTQLPEVTPGTYCARFEVVDDGTIPQVTPEDIQAC